MDKTKFKLTEAFLAKYKTITPPFGFNGLGALVYNRTYSRIKEDGQNEVWWETVMRVVEGCFNMQKSWIEQHQLGWNAKKGQRSAQEMYERIFNMKFLPPGRGLWAMGSAITEERGLYAALNNCAFVSTDTIKEDLSKSFCFLMDASMLGVGVGFDVKGEGKIKVVAPRIEETSYVIPDTREGWVESVKQLIDSYFNGANKMIFDYSLVRKAGEPIKGFGGVSSGFEPLRDVHEDIRSTLNKNVDKPITITTIVDIMNMIGKCVVAGNVRRCLPKGTLIHTTAGLVAIENVKVGDYVKTSKGTDIVSDAVYQGRQQLVAISTQLGEFNCTDKHKMAVLVSPTEYIWKMAKELLPGDRLVFPLNVIEGTETELPTWNYTKSKHSTTCKDIVIPKLDTDMSWLLGLIHGDGYVAPNFEDNGFNAHVSIACAPDYPEIITKCGDQLRRFGVNLCNVLPSPSDRSTKVRAQSKQLAWYMSQFKTAHKSLVIPKEILSGTIAQRGAYLAGLFDADGSAGRPINAVTTVYGDYAKQVQALYASLGIPVRFHKKRESIGNWQVLYGVDVVGSHAVNKFKSLVAIYSLKYEDTRTTSRSQNDYGYPSTWVRGMSYGKKWTPSQKQMTYQTYLAVGGNSSFIPIEVNDVNLDAGEADTYDISVKTAHEFVAQEGLLVHNTAEIVFGDGNSEEYLNLKNYKKNPEREMFGWTSNNSIFAELGMDYSKAANQAKVNGEPGFAWLENMQGYSRMNNGKDNKDHRVQGGNPCLEQSLESYELCCLVETFPANHESIEDYIQTLKYAYLYAKTVTLGKTHWPETNRVMLRNRRIGCSMSGVAQFITKLGLHNLKEWCEKGYSAIEKYDEVYSDWLAIPKSIKKTSIKPSGTVSLLAGATPGMHYPESRFYIRRIRLSKYSDLVKPLQEAGYNIEPCFGSEDSTVVVDIPVDNGPGIRTVSDVSMWEQLSLAAFLQKYWADNQVSCTVTFKKEEADQIEPALNFFQYQLKGISFLPKTEHGAYKQMPYEKIDESKFVEMTKDLKVLKLKKIKNEEADVEKFCNNDVCMLK